jgi:hypothetical protein
MTRRARSAGPRNPALPFPPFSRQRTMDWYVSKFASCVASMLMALRTPTFVKSPAKASDSS